MSQRRHSPRFDYFLAIGAVSAVLAAMPALGAEARATSDARARYLQEREMCLSGKSHQDRATCLRDAGAAYEEARRGALPIQGPVNYEQNALRRCDPLPAFEREACVARMRGEGTTRGSVADGGIYRELTIRQ